MWRIRHFVLQGNWCNRSFSSVQFSSVAQSCLTICDPMDCSMPGFPVHHQFPELTQTPSSHPAISSSVIPLSSCLQSFPASVQFSPAQFSSVAQSCPTHCNPMNRSTPGLPVHHQLLEFTQSHVHQVRDAIQPSHPLSSPSPAPNPSQHQSLFQ